MLAPAISIILTLTTPYFILNTKLFRGLNIRGSNTTQRNMSKSTKSSKKDAAAESSTAGASGANGASGALTAAQVSDLLEQYRVKLADDLKSSFDTLVTKLDKIQAEVSGHGQRISDLESNAEGVSQRLEQLEATCASLREDNTLLKSKLSDLEGRSRRQNIRIVGLPESVEGPRPTAFFSQLLVEVFGDQTLSSPPELDRAHRSLIPKPGPDERPRPVIIRFHRFQIKDSVMREARKLGTVEYRGHKLRFYEDYSADVLKQRAAYRIVMAELYSRGLRPSLLFPAKLRITLPSGEKRWLSSVSAATKFIQSMEEDQHAPP